jgi:hypothetical protein
MENSNKKIIFSIPGEDSVTDIVYSILQNNGLPETISESVEKSINNIPSKSNILKSAVYDLANKKITEIALVQLLQTQLQTTEAVAKKIVSDVNQRLIPFAKEKDFSLEQEETLQPIKDTEKDSFSSFIKKPEITNVEENEKIKYPEPKMSQKNPLPEKPIEKKSSGSDTYREPIE